MRIALCLCQFIVFFTATASTQTFDWSRDPVKELDRLRPDDERKILPAKPSPATPASPAPLAILSIFDQLKAYHAQGTLPSSADIKGWRAGRCYRAKDPNTTLAGILIGVETPLPQLIFASVSPEGRFSETRYDSLTPSDRKELREFIASSGFTTLPPASVEGNALTTTNASGNLTFAVTKFQQYLIEKLTCIKAARGECAAGELHEMCYFFPQDQSQNR